MGNKSLLPTCFVVATKVWCLSQIGFLRVQNIHGFPS